MTTMRFALVGVLLLAACGGSSSPTSADAATADAFVSACGKPGDLGNEMGVGKFCTSLSDCAGSLTAPLCSSLGDKETHFCTHTCSATAACDCGTGAERTCNANNQCGCTPTVCLGP